MNNYDSYDSNVFLIARKNHHTTEQTPTILYSGISPRGRDNSPPIPRELPTHTYYWLCGGEPTALHLGMLYSHLLANNPRWQDINKILLYLTIALISTMLRYRSRYLKYLPTKPGTLTALLLNPRHSNCLTTKPGTNKYLREIRHRGQNPFMPHPSFPTKSTEYRSRYYRVLRILQH